MKVTNCPSHASSSTTLNTSLNPLAPPFVPASPSIPRFPPRRSFKISQLNCRSLLSKMWYVKLENVLVTKWKSEILCLSETWLQPHSTTNTHFALPNYTTVYRWDRPNRQHGGGLVIYTLSDICTVHRPDLEHPDIECLAIQVTLSSNTKHFIFACYRPPSESPTSFLILFQVFWMQPVRNRLTWHFWQISTQSTALGIPKQILPGPDCFSCYSTLVSHSA